MPPERTPRSLRRRADSPGRPRGAGAGARAAVGTGVNRHAGTGAGARVARTANGNPAPGEAAIDPRELEPALQAGLRTLRLDTVSNEEQRALTHKLIAYLSLIAKWNRVYNLTALRDPVQMLEQHLLDSAAIVRPLLARLDAAGAHPYIAGTPRRRVVDVGSGAGLPGIVLAILRRDLDLLLVEPVGKKAAFLRQVAAELALTNVKVMATRVEALPPEAREPAPAAVVCRAYASLADYVASIRDLAGPRTVVAAMKAAVPDDEIAALPPGWRVEAAVPLEVPGLDAARHLIFLASHSAVGTSAEDTPAGKGLARKQAHTPSDSPAPNPPHLLRP